MSNSQCLAYLRQDNTTHTAIIRLPARHWSVIQAKQEELAEELNVPRVSRPVALRHILDEALKHGICHHLQTTTKE